MAQQTFEEWWNKEGYLDNWQSLNCKELARDAWQAAQPQWHPIETAPLMKWINVVKLNGAVACTLLHEQENKKEYALWQPLPNPPQNQTGAKNDRRRI